MKNAPKLEENAKTAQKNKGRCEIKNANDKEMYDIVYYSMIIFWAMFVWGRLALCQFVYYVIMPIAPISITFFAVALLIFSAFAIIFEWRGRPTSVSVLHSQFWRRP